VSQARIVGHVAAVYRYPVKSMHGETLGTVDLGWHGLAGDRRYGFVRPDNKSRQPWLTARQIPAMVRFVPRLLRPDDPERSELVVRAPEGHEWPLDSPELVSRLVSGTRFLAQLLHLGIGAFDSMPVSILSRPVIEGIAASTGHDIDIRQFRPNIVVEPSDPECLPECDWVGSTLRLGSSAAIRVDRPDARCMMIGINPETAAYDPVPLRHVVEARGRVVGVYGTPSALGSIAVGDPVWRIE
jgi:uncharacterized protein